ncbi:MAG: S1C family serine protease [Anaerolineae bacterium]
MRDLLSIIKHAITLIAGVILTLLVLPFLPLSLTTAPIDTPLSAPTLNPVQDLIVPLTLNEQEALLGDLYTNVAPSVVSINFALRVGEDFVFTPISSGSGFVIDADGHILTNAHVLQVPEDITGMIANRDLSISETRVEVRLFDGTITSAEIIGEDPDSDLAVIRIAPDVTDLRPIAFADSGNLRVGQSVVAIGNPFSNDWTMTTGIISALNRSIPGLEGFSIGGVIQTDAAINPGNSGGPLVNLNGEVIGVNSQINTEDGRNSGIGFAVPINLARKVAELLITEGDVAYSFLGIQSRPLDLDLINAFNLPNNLRGVAVLVALQQMPANDAGLRSLSGDSVDIITAIDGTPIHDFDELLAYLALNTVPGDRINLTVYRRGNYIELPLTLTDRPNNEVENTLGQESE